MKKRIEKLHYEKIASIIIWLLYAASVAVIILFNSIVGLLMYGVAFVKAMEMLKRKYRQQSDGLMDFIRKSQLDEELLCTTGALVVVVASVILVFFITLIYWDTRDCELLIDWLQRLYN